MATVVLDSIAVVDGYNSFVTGQYLSLGVDILALSLSLTAGVILWRRGWNTNSQNQK